jgi:hypothetical protein
VPKTSGIYDNGKYCDLIVGSISKESLDSSKTFYRNKISNIKKEKSHDITYTEDDLLQLIIQVLDTLNLS